MAITLVPKYVRALAEQLNAYYRVLRGTDPDSVDLRLNGGGRFAVHHSGTNAIVFQVTDVGAAGSYAPGDIGTPDIADGAVTSAKILDDTITNADVNGAANIAVGKLLHVGAGNVIRSNGTTNVAGQVVSADIANDTIVDGDIKSDAGILVTKIAHVGAGNVLRSTGSQNVGGPLVASDIPNGSITSAKILDNEIVNADINASAGILIAKLADVGANNVLRSSGAGNVAGKVVSADIANGAIVDANVAAAGTANIALGKLAPGTTGVLKSNGAAVSAGNLIVTGDMAINTINGDRIADGTILGAKLSGGAPPPSGAGVADAYKVYATDSAGTTVALRQVLTEMLASDAVLRRVTAAPSGSVSVGPSYGVIATSAMSMLTQGYPVRLDWSFALHATAVTTVSLACRVDGATVIATATHNYMLAGAWQQLSGHIWIVGLSGTPAAPVSHGVDLLWQSSTTCTLSLSTAVSTLTEHRKST